MSNPANPPTVTFNSLEDVANAGYVTDEWKRWQQGDCYTYAHALRQVRPDLRLGALDDGSHLFAHDDTHAYDSAGKHPLPYHGIDGTGTPELDVGETWYDGPDPEAIPAAIEHIKRITSWILCPTTEYPLEPN